MLRQAIKFLIVLVLFSTVAGLSAFFTLSFFIKGEESVIVPELSGKDAVFVLQLLGGLGLNTRVSGFAYDDAIPRNHVIQQSPEPGRTIKKGRDVSLVISRGTLTVTVPDLRGYNLPQALIVLEQNGLEAGNNAAVFSDTASRGAVIAQFPRPGRTARRSDSIDLLVSRGPRPASYSMPDLEGRLLDEAMLVMDEYKLMLDGVTTVYDKTRPEYAVIGQTPKAGHYVEENQKIRLLVNRRAKDEAMGTAHAGRLFRYRLPHGYLKQHIRLELSIYGMNVTLHDSLMPPGKEIWAFVPAHTQAALFLYLNDELVVSKVY